MYYLIVKVYEGRTLSPNAKSVFDWLTIGVTLILGLNMASSYKEIGLHMKPWFYAKSGVNIRDVRFVPQRVSSRQWYVKSGELTDWLGHIDRASQPHGTGQAYVAHT